MNHPWIVAFDWDGTLIHSLDIKIRNAGRLFAAVFGVEAKTVEAAYRRFSGIPRRQLFDAICSEAGLPSISDDHYRVLSRQFTRANLQSLAELEVEPETYRALEDLKSLGCPMYISSSADGEEIRSLAESLQITEYFVEILGSTPGFGKGSEHLNYIRNQHPELAERVVIVGDDPADIRLGREAGAQIAARAGTYPAETLIDLSPDVVIHSLSELPTWLATLPD